MFVGVDLIVPPRQNVRGDLVSERRKIQTERKNFFTVRMGSFFGVEFDAHPPIVGTMLGQVKKKDNKK